MRQATKLEHAKRTTMGESLLVGIVDGAEEVAIGPAADAVASKADDQPLDFARMSAPRNPADESAPEPSATLADLAGGDALAEANEASSLNAAETTTATNSDHFATEPPEAFASLAPLDQKPASATTLETSPSTIAISTEAAQLSPGPESLTGAATQADAGHDHGDAGPPAHWPDDHDGGDGAPTFSINEANLSELLYALNRSDESWTQDDFAGVTLTVAFPQELEDLPDVYASWFDAPVEEGLVAFEGFSALQQSHVMRALSGFSEFVDVEFVKVEPGETANFYYVGREYPNGEDDPVIGGISNGFQPQFGSILQFNTSRDSWDSMHMGGGGFGTVLHETGHSLGLSHPGEYSAFDDGGFPTYENAAEYVEDTAMYTLMSYFSGGHTGFSSGGRDWGFQTMRSHDMYVLQQLYGANWSTRAGDTIYGYNASPELSSSEFDFDTLAFSNAFFSAVDPDFVEIGPVFTIWDAGGNNDWLDLSGDENDVMLDLNPGAFSSTHGMTNNISIAHAPAQPIPSSRNVFIENARGGGGDDILIGNDVENDLYGGFGDDTLDGGDGEDRLFGGDGDDLLIGGFGDDAYDGGHGDDTVDFGYSSADWTITLDNGADGSATTGGDFETIRYVENATGGRGDDEIIGMELANALLGGEGDDTLKGRGGDDTLDGGLGDDVLRGGDGDDVLNGAWGADKIFGGRGADTINGGSGDDVISGGDGRDELHGLFGVDTVDYSYSNADWLVDLPGATASRAGGGAEIVTSFERAIMGGGDDTVLGGQEDNRFWSGAGDDNLVGRGGVDLLFGEDGRDRLNGGEGDDVLNGGAGVDTAVFLGASDGVVVDLALSGQVQNTGAGFDILIDIERLEGTEFGDILSGDGGANGLTGFAGGDLLFGRDGDDWLRGGAGADILEGGEGDDVIWGEEGTDAASYFFAASGVRVDLFKAGAQNTISAGMDVIAGVEDLIGSFHDDLLSGDDDGNRITAGAGDDFLNGRDGDDVLIAGDGDDVLVGGLGDDVVDGGAGVDWAHYAVGASNGVTVDLSVGQQHTGIGVDLIRNIENLFGSLGDDDLRGDDGANELWGSGGDDTIYGAGGDDVLRGGSGDDAIWVGLTAPLKQVDDFAPTPPKTPKTGADDLALLESAPYADAFVFTSASASSFASKTGDVATADASLQKFGSLPGSGSDRILFDDGWGDDVVFGFTAGVDVLDFSLVRGLDLIDLAFSEEANGVLIEYGENSVLLNDTTLNALTDGDFIV